jgi:hypothetical protein
MASSARIDELKKKFDENPRRYFAPLANEFRKGGDLEQAILICEEFLPHQPGHMSGHIVYGQALFESGRADDARTVFETALSLDPENLIALRHLGDIAGQQGDLSGARRWYERVLEADPRNEEIQALINGLDDGHSSRSFDSQPQHADAAPAYGHAAALESAPAAHHDHAGYGGANEVLPIDLDETVPHGVPVVTPERSAAAQESSSDDALGLSGIVPMPHSAELMPEIETRAEGFEATEFSAPEAPIQQTAGLQSAFEDETGIYGAAVTPIDGLDASHGAGSSAGADVMGAFPELSGDDGLVLPPHGDPIAPTAAAPQSPASDFPMLDGAFEMPGEAPTQPLPEAVAASEAAESMELMEFDMPRADDVPDAAPAGSALPVELPPEVIAAEAELVESGMSMEPLDAPSSADGDGASEETDSVGAELTFLDTTADEAPAEDAAAVAELAEPEAAPPATPFVTETMAELYLSQGFHEQALSVYQQLSAASPHDSRLADKVASLRSAAAATPAKPAGPTVREFLSRLASRRPGAAAAGAAPPDESDFAMSDPAATVAPAEAAADVQALEPQAVDAAPDEVAPSAPEQPAGGTIDALFGNKASGTEDSAASALAQAFGSAPTPPPPITGNPARPASGELSLDSVFRDGSARTQRTSAGFSFDQFFSQNPEGENTGGTARTSQELPAEGEPAEKSADDIEQFNSWLQGLKNR